MNNKSEYSTAEYPTEDTFLVNAVNSSVVTVGATLGYNAVQVVESLIMQGDSRNIWIELSAVDNIPSVFWDSILISISRLSTEMKHEFKAIGFPDTINKYHKFLDVFSKELYQGNQMIFIFNNFHLINKKTVLDFIIRLANVNFENFNIILLSYDEKVRFTGDFLYDISKVKNEDSSFTFNETKEYFKSHGIDISLKEIEKLHIETEGNPLGIRMICDYIKKHGYNGNEASINSKMYVYKQIEEKIFFWYGSEIQNLFIRVSLLENYPMELLKEISGDLWDEFKTKLQQNPFIHEYSYMNQYKISNLFLGFLTAKWELIGKKSKCETYMAAAQWCYNQSMTFSALSYYDKAERYDKVWDIIFRGGMERKSKEETDFLIGFIDNFPLEFMEQNPMAAVVRSALLYNNYKMDSSKRGAESIRKKWERRPDTEENRAFLGEVYILLGIISLNQGTQEFIDFFKKADSCLPEGSMFFGNKYKLVDMNNALVFASHERGQVELFTSALFEAMPYASRVMHGCGCGYEYLAAAEANYYRGELSHTVQYAYKAIYKAEGQSQGDIICSGYFLLIQAGLAKGDYTMIKDNLSRLNRYGENNPEFWDMACTAEAWVYHVLGFSERVVDLVLGKTPPISNGRGRLVKVASLIWQDRFYEALALIDELERLYKKRVCLISLLAIYIFKAICHYYLKNDEEVVVIFEEAYELSKGNKLYMLFISSGNNMRNIINSVRRTGGHNIPHEWLDTIYSKANTYSKRISVVAKEFNKEEMMKSSEECDLSVREKTLMVNLSQGLTRIEIADNMDVSINTVKSMLKNIYTKLGAINRADAVRIAQNSKII